MAADVENILVTQNLYHSRPGVAKRIKVDLPVLPHCFSYPFRLPDSTHSVRNDVFFVVRPKHARILHAEPWSERVVRVDQRV